MRVAISTLSILVAMGWAIGYFKFEAGASIHLTLVVAVLALIMQWLPSSKP
ncbi:lmo0937 family membrane protein [Fluviicola sp.]|uniref:lmo0937 family membrane protein n=1 Tax=Fluviicola sp. TaxID=1917219 RepID=UPI0031E1E8ED